ncbi:MAG TPA: hypothetical protein IAB63_08045 [Candidatus Onthocola gallistercoris]|uniref:Uncharacterized protein n=1 Tax=Candidatus Onthocola gallistercoris TaxID=2840876 RepID=A0A9D1KY62_9FIRM|nr:hypothetical protein [Candidatus Onthocola gallistercoris]
MKVDYISINNTKIANSIRKYDQLAGVRGIVQTNARSSRRKIFSQFVITQDLSYLEMTAADAVYSLYRQGVKKFTVRKVLLLMAADENISLPAFRRQRMDQIIHKLSQMKIYIDCRQEASDTNKMQKRYEGIFLPVKAEGKGYVFLEDAQMPLYAYGEAKKQMITVPVRLLAYEPDEGKEKESRLINSDENILLKVYLIHELEIVRNKKNKVTEKTFRIKDPGDSGVLSAMEIERSSFSEESYMNKIREVYRKTELLFGYWRRVGYLRDYRADKETYSFYVSQDMLCHDPSKLF